MTDIQTVTASIAGYRQLSGEEMALMNEGKALAIQCGEWVAKLRQYGDVSIPSDPPPKSPLDQRWVSIGATDLQRGFMAILRGIAQPTTF